jgi:hypothetical protein
LDENTPLDNLPVLNSDQLNALPRQASSVFYFDPDYRMARSLQFRVALERQVAEAITASVDFTQIATTRMDRIRDINLPTPVVNSQGRPMYAPSSSALARLRPDQRFGSIFITESSARSHYRSMTSTVSVRRQNYTVDANYTLGFLKTHDDHENGGFTSPHYTDANNLDNEFGWSFIDQRHQFMANGVVFLPAGFEVATTMRFNSARPFSPRVGSDANFDGVSNDRPLLDGQVVQRNTFRNKGFSDVSMRVQKAFTLPNENGRLLFSAEMFNIFNFDNVEVGSSQMTYGNSLNDPLTEARRNFGRVKDSVTGEYISGSTMRTSPFQVQLGMRVEF